MSIDAAAKCISASAILVEVVVPAARGRLSDTTKTTRAAAVHIVRARVERRSKRARRPQAQREATRAALATTPTPTVWGAPLPKRTRRWMPSIGTATLQTTRAEAVAPATPSTRSGRRRVSDDRAYLVVVADMACLLVVRLVLRCARRYDYLDA